MTISPSLFIPSSPSISAQLFRLEPSRLRTPFPCFTVHRRFISFVDYHKTCRSLVITRAKRREIVRLANPSFEVEEGKYSYEVETVINKLCSLPPRGSIARCLENFKSKLSLNDFALVFKEFAQRGDWQRSLRLFKHMQRQIWCKPNEHIYTIIISLLGRQGLLDKCTEIFDDMPTHGVARSVFSYTALINSYGRQGKYDVSIQLLKRMKAEKVPPSILTYNTVINSCARGGMDWEGLLGLFAEMRHEGVRPDIVTYNTLLSACADRGLGDEAAMVFRTMNEGGTVPDLTTYKYLVGTFEKLNGLDKVSELLKEMESSGSLPDVSAYNLLLEACARIGDIKDAMGVFRQMQEAGCVPNASTYSTLLNLYGEIGRYDEVRELFLEMKVNGIDPDPETYNILIDVFGKGGYFKEVVTLFHDMIEENVEPNIATYEGLTYACGKGGLQEDAKKILLHMNENDFVPSSKTFTGVIEAYGQAALYEEAFVAFNTMNELQVSPTLETYNSLVNMYARGGLYKESEVILRKMGEAGVVRNRDSFNGLIEGYRQGGQFEEAIKAYVEMEQWRIDPDEQTLEAVLSVYSVAGLVDESKEQFQEIKSSGILPSVICYCMMLAVYAKNDRRSDAYELLNEMLTHRVSNVHQVIGQLIKGEYDDEANWQMVEFVFDRLSSEGCGLGMRFYNTLLEALWWLGQKARAAKVLREATKRGLFPELYRKSKLVWSVDVHRLWEGGAYTAISVWLNNMYQSFISGEDFPQLASIVVVRGKRENMSQSIPLAKAVYSFVEENGATSFFHSSWNKGRITCQKLHLKRLLSDIQQTCDGTEKQDMITLSNLTLSLDETRYRGDDADDTKISQNGSTNSKTSKEARTELLTSTT
ncbi:Pentatricopeptide repeat-containing protein At1g74850, chloroplastic [Linum perenne]